MPEVLVADPALRTARIWQLRAGPDSEYEETAAATCWPSPERQLAEGIAWP